MSIYTHKHHIIPEHMGGTNDPENLVEVTVEKHAELHKQLWEDLGHQEDYIAWRCLSGQISNQEAIREAIKLAQFRMRGMKKKPCSEERKLKISAAKKGKKINYPKNRKSRSDEDKKKVSDKMKGPLNHFYGKTHTEETREKIRTNMRKNNL
jgi:hypothetical protein